MKPYSKGRKISAMVGVVLILTTASGGTSVMNAIIPFLLEGMQIDLTMFMIGPTCATICAALMSALGTKVINLITPKWSMLLGTFCACFTMFAVGMATSVPLWIVANILNGIVLAFATYAAASGIVAEFYGENPQKAFGVVAGVVAFCVAGWMALTSVLISFFDYRTLFYIYAACILIIGVLSNLILIGKIPRRRPASASNKKDESKASAPEQTEKELSGFTLGELLKRHVSIYLFLIAMAMVAWCASGITSYATVYFTSFEMAAATAAALLSLFTFCAAFLKVFSGFFIKRFGPRIMTAMIFLSFALGIVCISVWTFTQIFALAVIGIILCSFISFWNIIPGLFIPDLYGMKDYVGINSAGMAAYYVGAVTVFLGLSFVITSQGMFVGFILVAIIAIVVMALFFVSVVSSPMKKHKK